MKKKKETTDDYIPKVEYFTPTVFGRQQPLSEPKHLNEYKLRRANQKDEIEFLLQTLERSIQTGMNTFDRDTNIALIKRIYDKFQEQWTN